MSTPLRRPQVSSRILSLSTVPGNKETEIKKKQGDKKEKKMLCQPPPKTSCLVSHPKPPTHCHTHRHTQTHTVRHTHRQTETHTYLESLYWAVTNTHRETDTQTDTHTHTHTHIPKTSLLGCHKHTHKDTHPGQKDTHPAETKKKTEKKRHTPGGNWSKGSAPAREDTCTKSGICMASPGLRSAAGPLPISAEVHRKK